MLRFKILVSIVPLFGAAVLARLELFPASPCISLDTGTVQIAQIPAHADLRVSFTDDPSLATVRVALTDSSETADFAVVDDATESEDGACAAPPGTQFVGIVEGGPKGTPVIYLSHDGAADYRIFVRSTRFSAREAAALIVGAHRGQPRIADAAP